MDVLFAAIGATLVAVLEIGLDRFITIGSAHPHPVLVLGVVWTIVVGIDSGIVWAFIGGVVLDVLTGRPFGASSIALLLAVGGAYVFSRSLFRLRALAPVIATPVLSLAYSLALFVLTSGARQAVAAGVNADVLIPGALYDTVLAVLLGPLAVSVHDRRLAEERLEW
jgi:rod shape-determining protein MreD